MTNLPARIPVVPAEGKLAHIKIMHAEMEQNHGLLVPVFMRNQSINSEIHITIRGRIIMSDKQSSGGGKQLREG
jgi:hypothetical protein